MQSASINFRNIYSGLTNHIIFLRPVSLMLGVFWTTIINVDDIESTVTAALDFVTFFFAVTGLWWCCGAWITKNRFWLLRMASLPLDAPALTKLAAMFSTHSACSTGLISSRSSVFLELFISLRRHLIALAGPSPERNRLDLFDLSEEVVVKGRLPSTTLPPDCLHDLSHSPPGLRLQSRAKCAANVRQWCIFC